MGESESGRYTPALEQTRRMRTALLKISELNANDRQFALFAANNSDMNFAMMEHARRLALDAIEI